MHLQMKISSSGVREQGAVVHGHAYCIRQYPFWDWVYLAAWHFLPPLIPKAANRISTQLLHDYLPGQWYTPLTFSSNTPGWIVYAPSIF